MEFIILILLGFGGLVVWAYDAHKTQNFARITLEGAGFRDIQVSNDGRTTGRTYGGEREVEVEVKESSALKGVVHLTLSCASPNDGLITLDAHADNGDTLTAQDRASVTISQECWVAGVAQALLIIDRSARAHFDSLAPMFFASVHSITGDATRLTIEATLYMSSSKTFDERLRAQPFSDRMLTPYQSGTQANELLNASLRALLGLLDSTRKGLSDHSSKSADTFWRRAWMGSFGLDERASALAALVECVGPDALWSEVRKIGHGGDLVGLWQQDPERARALFDIADRAVMLDHALRHDRAIFDELHDELSPAWLDELRWRHAKYVLHYLMQAFPAHELAPYVSRLAKRCGPSDHHELMVALGDDAEEYSTAGALSVADDETAGALSQARHTGDLTEVE